MNTRRTFLAGMLLVGAMDGFAGRTTAAQSAPSKNPQEKRPTLEPATDAPPLPNAEKKILEDNDKDMKKKVERLYQLAAELKAEVDKTDSSKVMSLNLVKKAEEIEKLAREIKNRSKGA